MVRVVAYGRSGVVPAQEQIETVERWARASGYEVTSPAGRAGGAPSIRDVLLACRQGRADVVGLTDLSRLAHDEDVLAAVLSILEGADARIAVVSTDGLATMHTPGSAEFRDSPELTRALVALDAEAGAGGQDQRPTDARWSSGSRPRYRTQANA